MRIWLGAAFAAVGLITAVSVYLFVRDSSGRTLAQRSTDLAVGQAFRVVTDVNASYPRRLNAIVENARGDNFDVWILNQRGEPITGDPPSGRGFEAVEPREQAIHVAQRGERFVTELPQEAAVVAFPVRDERAIVRAIVFARAEPPTAVRRSIEELRGDAVRALAIAVGVGILVGFLVSSVIAIRVKRLASSAERLASGAFEEPIPSSGGDEIGDLAHSLDTMREALRESFDMLATERDRLSAILDGLTEAVMVVGADGEVRFSNPASRMLISNGRPLEQLGVALRRAAERGSAEHPSLRVRGRVWALQARSVPAERAVLLVARDRTVELRRELAEREFVSNAAHELRNPIAGISGAIEVLKAGAKDDPEARDHFLARLGDDSERMSRLIESLLTLARVEAVGESENVPVVEVSLAAEEAAEAVTAPDGVELHAEVDPDLVARGDPILLRQVLIGLLTNAGKNTPPPGRVSLRARRLEDGEVMIEVEDTGTGIPAEEQDRVFERFYRGSGSLETEGFGLGLSIAKRMVDVMDGDIGVRSEPGGGSTFWVRLSATASTPTPVP